MSEKFVTTPPAGSVPGSEWRILAWTNTKKVELENQGVLDEVVIQPWFHLEQLDERQWWMRIGDARVFVTVGDKDDIRVDIERGFYEETTGETTILSDGV